MTDEIWMSALALGEVGLSGSDSDLEGPRQPSLMLIRHLNFSLLCPFRYVSFHLDDDDIDRSLPTYSFHQKEVRVLLGLR